MSEEELRRGLDRWFRNNYESLLYQVKHNIAKNGMTMYAEELLSHVILWTLERSHEMKEQMLQDNKLENYILRTCSMQLRSSTSPFYREARRFKLQVRSGAMPEMFDDFTYLEDNELYECMIRELNNIHWYYKKLVEEKWFNNMTYQDIRKKYGITLASIRTDLNIAYNLLREKCDC